MGWRGSGELAARSLPCALIWVVLICCCRIAIVAVLLLLVCSAKGENSRSGLLWCWSAGGRDPGGPAGWPVRAQGRRDTRVCAAGLPEELGAAARPEGCWAPDLQAGSAARRREGLAWPVGALPRRKGGPAAGCGQEMDLRPVGCLLLQPWSKGGGWANRGGEEKACWIYWRRGKGGCGCVS